jgi:hypothetical protein
VPDAPPPPRLLDPPFAPPPAPPGGGLYEQSPLRPAPAAPASVLGLSLTGDEVLATGKGDPPPGDQELAARPGPKPDPV